MRKKNRNFNVSKNKKDELGIEHNSDRESSIINLSKNLIPVDGVDEEYIKSLMESDCYKDDRKRILIYYLLNVFDLSKLIDDITHFTEEKYPHTEYVIKIALPEEVKNNTSIEILFDMDLIAALRMILQKKLHHSYIYTGLYGLVFKIVLNSLRVDCSFKNLKDINKEKTKYPSWEEIRNLSLEFVITNSSILEHISSQQSDLFNDEEDDENRIYQISDEMYIKGREIFVDHNEEEINDNRNKRVNNKNKKVIPKKKKTKAKHIDNFHETFTLNKVKKMLNSLDTENLLLAYRRITNRKIDKNYF